MSHALAARRNTKIWEGALTQSGQRGILHHGTLCSVYKLREIGWEGVIAAQLGISQQVVSNYTGHHSFFLGFISLFVDFLFIVIAVVVLLLLFCCCCCYYNHYPCWVYCYYLLCFKY